MKKAEIYEFFQSLYLFSSLNEEELSRVVDLFSEVSYSKGETIFEEGEPGDFFYIVVWGTVKITREAGYIGKIGSKEYLGEGALIHNRNRSATATADSATCLLRIDKAAFIHLLNQYPRINKLLNLLTESYSLARRKVFNWLGKDEIIRFIDRRHKAVLISRLTLPVMLIIGAFILFLASSTNGLGNIVFFITLVIIIPWSIWVWVDWGNDFYIVTDKRIVWLEKVVWFFDQRREAPLETILSVNSKTSQIQRLIGYADIIVRTYTGQITMRNAAHADELEGMIQEYWHLVEERIEEKETKKITQTIRSRLGFGDDGEDDDKINEDVPLDNQKEPRNRKTNLILPVHLGNFFKTRFEYDGVITYRKHVYFLLRQIWLPSLIFLAVSLSLFARIFNIMTLPSLSFLLVISTPVFLYTLIVIGYKTLDWANDRYQLTEKEIVDLDKKPLGEETRRSAPLENILSLDYKRVNIIQRTLNFGTVIINVGDARFDFEMVVNPSMVQREIFEHYYAAKQKKGEEEAQRRREDMVEFLAIYHEEKKRHQRSKNDTEKT